jgi:hypothetical protein
MVGHTWIRMQAREVRYLHGYKSAQSASNRVCALDRSSGGPILENESNPAKGSVRITMRD